MRYYVSFNGKFEPYKIKLTTYGQVVNFGYWHNGQFSPSYSLMSTLNAEFSKRVEQRGCYLSRLRNSQGLVMKDFWARVDIQELLYKAIREIEKYDLSRSSFGDVQSHKRLLAFLNDKLATGKIIVGK